MNAAKLIATAQELLAGGKGLLAMDESNGTCDRHLAAEGIAPTAQMRRAWRRGAGNTAPPWSCDSR